MKTLLPIASATLALAFFAASHVSAAAVIDLTPAATATAEERDTGLVLTRFEETGRFLALMPVPLSVTVRVTPEEGVALEYPWYSALTVDSREALTTELKVAVDTALRATTVGKVVAAGEKKSFSPEEVSAIKAAVEEVLEKRFGPRSE
jgi:hypothetical protein